MSGSRELDGRVAIVTGAARNIGRAIALALAAAGASVAVNVLKSLNEARETAELIKSAGGAAAVIQADVATPQGAQRLVEETAAAFGKIDILVNNAAVRRETEFKALAYDEWRSVVATILDGAYLMAHAALPFIERSDAGAIVNIGGLSAHTGARNRAHVVAAKAGLAGLTRALAHDLSSSGVTVNCVAPGMIDTIRGGSAASAPHHHQGRVPVVGRLGTPQEIASLVCYLAGPHARYLTGQTLHANGGLFMP
ncbi:MAG: SDR family oxidoreductase [Parvibaculaceae bacterium]